MFLSTLRLGATWFHSRDDWQSEGFRSTLRSRGGDATPGQWLPRQQQGFGDPTGGPPPLQVDWRAVGVVHLFRHMATFSSTPPMSGATLLNHSSVSLPGGQLRSRLPMPKDRQGRHKFLVVVRENTGKVAHHGIKAVRPQEKLVVGDVESTPSACSDGRSRSR